ncbi:methyltransferase domain-containing protein [Paenibacillus peoriae]|uniref:SAM-dependent methyltransferase n=1 Tax=Paenibacillus peoriae TaxID=59893 RepID=UPI00026C633E|nr:class I SAM-dependent methyltransferase [Paenibacillus peoriae]MEC0182209.1 methyltransferase domain-containing protein [Paenibacillus peoriae]
MNKTANEKSAHLFLASLGKTRLRPGGKAATERILEACQITPDTKLLEVAPNMGTTAIHIAKTYGCNVTGIDLHEPSVLKARENIKTHGLENSIHIEFGNALSLPFADESFDVVVNEAMLSMLPLEQKRQALKEFMRVLKPGGRLATHDLLVRLDPEKEENRSRLNDLRKVLYVNAQPMMESAWSALFNENGFSKIDVNTGSMTLLSLKGLIVDEGWEGTINLLNNACQDQDSKQYLFRLISTFDDNADLYGHITFVATK